MMKQNRRSKIATCIFLLRTAFKASSPQGIHQESVRRTTPHVAKLPRVCLERVRFCMRPYVGQVFVWGGSVGMGGRERHLKKKHRKKHSKHGLRGSETRGFRDEQSF